MGMGVLKLQPLIVALLLTTVIASVSCAGGAQDRLDPAALQKRHQQLTALYWEKRKAQYDLSEVDPLVKDFEQARKAKDWPRAVALMDQVEAALLRAKPPGAVSSGPTAVPPGTPSDGGPVGPGLTPAPIVGRPPANGVTTVEGFGFGLEYSRLNMAANFSSIGATWARIGPLTWERVEPKPPVKGRHNYQWELLDTLVRQHQAAGFRDIQFVTYARSRWAGNIPARGSPEVSVPPKPEHWKDYEDFIYNLVERYDGDGVEDMPGLLAPVRYVAIESEAQHEGYWYGTVEDYRRLLTTAYAACKRANSQTQVMLSGIIMADLFDDYPSDEVLQQRIKNLPPQHRKAFDFIVASLAFKDIYDIADFHYNFDYKGAYATMAWMKAQMRKSGFEKPIWAGDAAASTMLDRVAVPLPKAEADATWKALSEPGHPKHGATVAWYEKEQATNLTKKFVVGMHAGVRGICMGNFDDWKNYWGGRDWKYQGIRRPDNSAKPAYWAYQLVVQKTADTRQIEKLASSPNVYAYKLTTGAGTVWALWCDRGTEAFALPVEAGRVRITPAYAGPSSAGAGDRSPLAAQAAVAPNQTVELTLTTVPVFVEQMKE